MLTSRGWWFLIAVFGLLAVGGLVPPVGLPALSLIGLALLLWFLTEWLLFSYRVYWVVPGLRVERELCDERGPVNVLWAGRAVRVRALVRTDGRVGLPYLRATDRIPVGVEIRDGQSERDAAVVREQPLELGYQLNCPAPGILRFEGVAVRLADFQGFFYHQAFLHEGREVQVRPPLVDAAGRSPGHKRHNLLPPPGLHRHRRPGSGSELLDLRDYLPGDPPKLIAWKASARRDRLITKEFESEVPVRCTLFVDTSQSVRLGPPRRNALSRLVEIAGAVAQAAVGNRDLVGLALVDEGGARYLRPARTARHLAEVLSRLTDAAALAPSTGAAEVGRLIPLAVALAREIYPARLQAGLNRVPWTVRWFWPLPRQETGRGFLTRRLSTGWAVGLAGGLGAIGYLLGNGVGAAAGVGLAVLTGLLTEHFLPVFRQVFSPGRRRLAVWRKQLAALLAAGPGGLARLMESDTAMAWACQQFLAEHHAPYPLPLYDADGRYLFAAAAKVPALADCLLRAVGKGHDNELFVLLADLLEQEDLGPLLRAITVTKARHHRVVVVCPWPPGLSPPEDGWVEAIVHPAASLPQLTRARFHQAYRQLRRALARLGVPMLSARAGDPAHFILERIELLRSLERSR